MTLTGLAAEDWRKLLAAGKESFTQVLGRVVAAVEVNRFLTERPNFVFSQVKDYE